MPRTKFRPHAEAHAHEGDGWSLDLFDWDPVRGLVLIAAFVGLTFAATVTIREAYQRVLGDRGGERP
jgi:hypothetical protein